MIPPRPARTVRRRRLGRVAAILARGWPPPAHLTDDEARAAGAVGQARRRRDPATPLP